MIIIIIRAARWKSLPCSTGFFNIQKLLWPCCYLCLKLTLRNTVNAGEKNEVQRSKREKPSVKSKSKRQESIQDKKDLEVKMS